MDELLIEKVSERKILYEIASRRFKDIQSKQLAWACVAEEVGQTVEWCIRRFRSLKRDYFLFKNSRKQPSGSAVKPTKARLDVYSRMTFLDEPNEPKKTTSNIPSNEIIPEEESHCAESIPYSNEQTFNVDGDSSGINNESLCETDAILSPKIKTANPRKRGKSSDTVLLETLVQQLTETENQYDEYAAFGKAIGDGIRRMNSQRERDYAMAHLRFELYKLQRNSYMERQHPDGSRDGGHSSTESFMEQLYSSL